MFWESSCAGCNGLVTHPIFDGGHTLAIIFPLMRPMGTGP